LVERYIRIVEVRGSNPLSSTTRLLGGPMAGTWPRHTAPSVAAYIAALPAADARSLRRLRDAILAAAPGGKEEISYRVPAICFPNGGRIHFGARRGGLSLYAGHVSEAFAEDLSGFTVSGTTIHFTADHELPIALIKRITKRVISNAEERAAARAKRRASGQRRARG
jgi:uncharacterized protein YdhG (YjbR/CyaY superfamily)